MTNTGSRRKKKQYFLYLALIRFEPGIHRQDFSFSDNCPLVLPLLQHYFALFNFSTNKINISGGKKI